MLKKPLLTFALCGSFLTGCAPFAPKYGKGGLKFSKEIRDLNKQAGRQPVIHSDKSKHGILSVRYNLNDQNTVTVFNYQKRNSSAIIDLDEMNSFTSTKTDPQTKTTETMIFDGRKSFTVVKTAFQDTLYTTAPIWGGMDRDKHKAVFKAVFGEFLENRRFDTPPNILLNSVAHTPR